MYGWLVLTRIPDTLKGDVVVKWPSCDLNNLSFPVSVRALPGRSKPRLSQNLVPPQAAPVSATAPRQSTVLEDSKILMMIH
jgi:hypothetical protein